MEMECLVRFQTEDQFRITIELKKSQLPLFVFRPDLISNRQWYWLRDVISSAYFAYVDSGGRATYGSASGAGGVRPYFLIG